MWSEDGHIADKMMWQKQGQTKDLRLLAVQACPMKETRMDELQNYQTLLQITNATINERTREGLFREIATVLSPVLL